MSCIPRCPSCPSCPAPPADTEPSAVAGPAPAVENPVERPGNALAQAIDQRPAPPVAPIELLRLVAIGREDGRRLRGERRILDLLVRLEIPAEAPAVEVARAEAHPVVAQRHLAVQHTRLILEDAHTVAQQLAIEAPRRVTHPRMVGLRAGNEQPDIDTAARGATQRLAEAARRHEISAHDPRAPQRA